ncbi:NAD-dependent epimerase/dehydratase family protein [Pararhodobacter zhoushanensis]|uniref:NAD-dependent epimerase/dehydratase family protein n=1 Tax=Pararhodobacter zhoushanensis TaxID=2479545 RepID=A0ABT3GUY0_9RHOB|nr:NAD-dependent epimerase/dehydratase family protein [Pararhodobacter zhoushanensis]MCW1931324.1 NAD-dependent epimerase/dehydratase family protein [Pararhodobacter zhoushanensis]
MTGTILIAGASGGIGRRAVQAFTQAGWTVRLYDRSTDLTQAAQGVDVIFNALNPPMYRNWPVEIPRITRMVIDAARASGATVLMPGTVYVYGDQQGPWREDTPHRAASRKGQIRIDMEKAYRAAASDGVRTTILRAGDFLDAENPQTLFNLVVLKGAAKGKVTATGNPDAPRAYANLTDLSRAMVLLAEKRAELSAFADIGFPGLTFSYRDLAQTLQGVTGHPTRVGRFPWWALKIASPVWGFAREMSEMRYLHETPHRIDGTRFQRMFPDFQHTALAPIVAAHLTKPAATAAAVPA